MRKSLMHGFAVAMGTSLLVVACAKHPANTVTIDPSVPASHQSVIRQAVSQLTAVCTGLQQRAFELTGWRAGEASAADDASPYLTQKLGWSRWVEVKIDVVPNARALADGTKVAGQTLDYDLGGSPLPGIVGKTKSSQLMCGTMPVSNSPENPYTFIRVSDMKMLDTLGSGGGQTSQPPA